MAARYAWGDKQRGVISTLAYGAQREMIASGPVQSGKSAATVYGFFAFADQWNEYDFLLCSRSQRQMDGAIIRYAKEFAEDFGRQFKRSSSCWTMTNRHGGVNRFYPLLGSNIGSEGRARSFSAAAALCDEATLYPENFLTQIVSRCSVPGAKICLSTNPDSPEHPIYRDWVKGDNVESWEFTLDDNPGLSEEYKESLKRVYSGAALRRMVYGEWVTAEGAIYPHVPIGRPPAGRAQRYVIAADWAHSGWTHAVRLGQYGRIWYCEAEWTHNGQTHGMYNDIQLAEAVNRELVGKRSVHLVVSDPSAPNFRAALSHVMQRKTHNAVNDVPEGIQYTRRMMEDGDLVISPDCRMLISQMHNYRWDERAAILGEDKPIKENDHGPDALRYGVYSMAMAESSESRRRPKVKKWRSTLPT